MVIFEQEMEIGNFTLSSGTLVLQDVRPLVAQMQRKEPYLACVTISNCSELLRIGIKTNQKFRVTVEELLED